MKYDRTLAPQRKNRAKLEAKERKSTEGRSETWFAFSFAELQFDDQVAGAADAARFEISRHFLIRLLRPMFDMVHFDPSWYQAAYPDINAALQAGTLTDLKGHYCEFGFFEHRLPRFVRVDEMFYLAEYPDIGIAVSEGRLPSAQWHFETFGFREGRLPSRGWRFSDLLLDDPSAAR